MNDATIFNEQWKDHEGRPAGGIACGRGFAISWQNGPLGRGDDRREPNGAFVETILEAVVSRLEFYQDSPFACSENAAALRSINAALESLRSRTKRREESQTEGTHLGN